MVFPELSLTNYEPELGRRCALDATDPRLLAFQRHADANGTAVAVGAPLRNEGKPIIALLVFAPGRAVTVIGKRHLHADEVPYFAPHEGVPSVLDLADRVGVAICYEISVPEHTDSVMAGDPAVYVASVAKTPGGVSDAYATLSETARRHGVPALMVNSVGTCEGQRAGGGSVAIGRDGAVTARLGDAAEGVLIVDTATEVGKAVSVADASGEGTARGAVD